MACSGSHSKQVTEQSFEAGLSAPGFMQMRINQDLDASCPVISAEDKHPRINVIKTRREEIRSGWNRQYTPSRAGGALRVTEHVGVGSGAVHKKPLFGGCTCEGG